VRPALLGFLLALNAAGWCQEAKTVTVSFPTEGDREVWIQEPDAAGVAATTPASGTGVQIEAPGVPGKAFVYAHDKTTGNVAEKPLAEVLKSGVWKVEAKDEKRVFRMDFVVVSDGKPVASALVRGTVGNETKTGLVAPGDQGRASLFLVPVGSVRVVVEYKVNGATRTTPPQIFEAKLGAGTPAARQLVIADKVETLAPATGQEPKGTNPETKAERAEPPASSPSPIASLVNLILGLAVIGGVAAGVVWYVRKNPKQVEDALKKVGLGDQQPPAAASPPTPVQPEPIKPIVLDLGAPAQAVVTTAVSVKNPRLVKADGSVVLLAEGGSEVGRDPGLAVSLEGESTVSLRHARLDRKGDDVILTDLGSTNGTFVNGAKLNGETILRPGDSVQFGAVQFRFES
jgi:hypothetical protein